MTDQKTSIVRIPGLRRGVLLASMLYLLLPSLFFLCGWVNRVVALPLALLMLVATFFVWWQIGRTWKPADAAFICTKKDLIALFAALVVALLMVEAISFHAHMHQPGDFWIRNPIYNMLLTQDWPIYGTSGKQFIYYHDFWLVPAWVSRMFPSLSSATVIFVWTYIGLALAVMMFFTRFRGRILIFMVFLCCFGTLVANLNPIYKVLSIPGEAHTKYAGVLMILEYLGYGTTTVYSYFWSCFCHGFNNILPMLLLISVLFSRCVPVKHLLFVMGLGSVYSPLGAVLMMPYLSMSLFYKRFSFKALREVLLNIPMWVCAACVLLHAMFFLGLTGQEGGTEWRFIWSDSTWWSSFPAPFSLCWVRVLRVALVYTTFFVPLYFIMGHRFRRLLLWRFMAVTALLMLLVVYGRMNNELLGKGSPLMFIGLSMLLCIRYATAGKQRRFWIFLLLVVSCLHVPTDLIKRGILKYSWDPEVMSRNIEDPLHGTIDVPGFRHYQNFWGDNRFSPVLYGEPGEAMRHWPLNGVSRPQVPAAEKTETEAE